MSFQGTFAAIPTNSLHAPPLEALRLAHKPESDVYFYRAVIFCKEYARTGQIAGQWAGLRSFIMWPDSIEDLQNLFRSCGVVHGQQDELWSWDQFNGAIIRKYEREAARQKRLRKKARKAGRASGKARRRKAQRSILGEELARVRRKRRTKK